MRRHRAPILALAAVLAAAPLAGCGGSGSDTPAITQDTEAPGNPGITPNQNGDTGGGTNSDGGAQAPGATVQRPPGAGSGG